LGDTYVFDRCVPAVGLTIFQICISSAYATYITQLTSYMTLLKHYPNIAREYKSPFGVYGAWWGIAVFSLALIASLGFQPNAWITPSVMSVYILCCSCYYWLVARHNQVISPEEEVR
jgi:ethanolamine permease